jgi:hypothetical protein
MNAAVESNAIDLIVLDLMLQGESDSHLDADSSRDGLEYSAPAAPLLSVKISASRPGIPSMPCAALDRSGTVHQLPLHFPIPGRALRGPSCRISGLGVRIV